MSPLIYIFVNHLIKFILFSFLLDNVLLYWCLSKTEAAPRPPAEPLTHLCVGMKSSPRESSLSPGRAGPSELSDPWVLPTALSLSDSLSSSSSSSSREQSRPSVAVSALARVHMMMGRARDSSPHCPRGRGGGIAMIMKAHSNKQPSSRTKQVVNSESRYLKSGSILPSIKTISMQPDASRI